MRFNGKLKSWEDERGFGFIEPTQGGEDIFIHIKAFPRGTGRPEIGVVLTFEVEIGPKGTKRAKSVELNRIRQLHGSLRRELPIKWTLWKLFAIPFFIVTFVCVASIWTVSPMALAIYLMASSITFLVYALDKSAAVKGQRRTPETTLHLLGLACGWPGALMAQQLLRHKTSKMEFMSFYWLIVVLNFAGFVLFHWPIFNSFIRSLAGRLG